MYIEMIKMLLIAAQLAVAVTSDVRYFKVRNEMNIIFAIAGILYNAFFGNGGDVISSIGGLIIPFIILLPLYILNMLGAGDIKLLCAIGALLGMKSVIMSMALSFIFGAFVALLIMAADKNFHARFLRLYIYLKSCFLSMSIMPYYQLNAENDGKMHFTIPIALGTIAANLI